MADINNNNIWIDVETLAKLKNITRRAVRLALNQNKYEYKVENIRDGKTYKIKLSTLEEELQLKYFQEYYDDYKTCNNEVIELSRDNLIKILRYIEVSWRKQRAAKKKDETTKETNIDVDSWTGTMSEPLGKKIKKAVDSIIDEESIEPEVASMIVKHLHDIAPEYADYHFRELHKEVKDVSEEYYRHENYYTAFIEALKRYKNKVKEKSGVTATEDYNIMSESFGKDKILKVAKNKLRPNGEEFSQKTLDNIEDGQKYLSMGIVQGGRNVLSHEECKELQESGLFTEKDCLDMLSLLSHLFKRLDDA